MDELAARPTPKPMVGTWTLTAPDGRTWRDKSPLHCCSAELRERVPADVALARMLEANKPDPDDSLLQMSLDALEYHCDQTRPIERSSEAIAALRARLGHNAVMSRPEGVGSIES